MYLFHVCYHFIWCCAVAESILRIFNHMMVSKDSFWRGHRKIFFISLKFPTLCSSKKWRQQSMLYKDSYFVTMEVQNDTGLLLALCSKQRQLTQIQQLLWQLSRTDTEAQKHWSRLHGTAWHSVTMVAMCRAFWCHLKPLSQAHQRSQCRQVPEGAARSGSPLLCLIGC